MSDTPEPLDFVRQRISDDLASGKHDSVVTRFPPEPNGHLHIGHAKSIVLNFGIAAEFGGTCRLRFDDTNPSKEDQAYVDAIIRDVAWLTGRDDIEVRYASDAFEQMYQWARQLIEAGLAYVDDQDPETMRANRGTVTKAGVDSPFRDRPAAESLDLLARMRAGEFAEGSRVLRAKIDMAHPNMLMRDPLMYRIVHADHHRTGDAWRIYPLYDWAHGLEDSLEGVTHSICTLEFETHRPLYDWFLDQLGIHHPQQIEFNRLNLTYTVMSKRRLLELVERGIVADWDDPRMPTIAGLRRRGVSPAALRAFVSEVGVTKVNGVTEWALLEHHVRKDLNTTSPRTMAVLRPLAAVIDNWPSDRNHTARVPVNPENPDAGMREVPFSGELWLEQDDFMLEAPGKFFRLSPGGRWVRLRGVGLVRCTSAETDADGQVTRIHLELDESTLDGSVPEGVKVKATIHWLSAAHCTTATVNLYQHLFTAEDPTVVADGQDWVDGLAPDSCEVLDDARIPPDLAATAPGGRVQFERLGYFAADHASTTEAPVFNRTATLRDAWAKAARKR